jgi:hypothetical protein
MGININIPIRIEVKQLWVVTLILGIFAFVNTHPIRPHDFWWHLALGREIALTGQIPPVDVYSFTMSGQPFPSYQMFWLVDLGMYGLYSLGGPALVIFVQSSIITTSYLLILIICYQISRRWGVSTLAIFFAAALGVHNWNVRPQSISYLIGAAYLYAIYAYRRRPSWKWLVVFPLGMILWVNSHGSFLVGIVLIGIWLGDEAWQLIIRRRSINSREILKSLQGPLLSLVLALLVCLVNPPGFSIFSYVTSLSSNPVIQNLVPEWAPPTFSTQIGMIFFIGLLFSAVVLALSPRRPDFFQITTFLAFTTLSLMTTRGIVWFGLLMAPVLSYHLGAISEQIFGKVEQKVPRKTLSWVNTIFLLMLFLMAFLSLPWFKHLFPFQRLKTGLISRETPVAAVEFLLDQSPPGNLFHEMGFGSYLIWAAQIDYQVFTDPRIELYPSQIWNDYIYLSNGFPGWEVKLDEYNINTLMLSPNEQFVLINAVEKSGIWSMLYKDESAVVFTRNE